MILQVLATFIFAYLLAKFYVRLFSAIGDDSVSLDSKPFRKYETVWAVVLYLVCTCLFFYPQWTTLSTHLIGPPEDNMHFYWNIWRVNRIASDQIPFMDKMQSLTFTNEIFYPEGTTLLYVTYSFFNQILGLLLVPMLGITLTYNGLILLSFVLAGLGGFLLVRYVTKSFPASLLGGYIFAFNPSHFAHSLHHLNISSIQFIPFFVLYFIKAVKGRHKRDLVLAAVFFLLISLSSWYYMVQGIYFIVFSYVYLAIRHRQLFLRDFIFKAAVAVIPAIIILSPWMVPMFLLGVKNEQTRSIGISANLLAFFIPHPFHALGEFSAVRRINRAFIGNEWENSVYFGWVNMVMLLMYARKYLRDLSKYLIGLFTFTIVSLGAWLQIYGQARPVYLPQSLLLIIPVLSQGRVSSRFIVLVYLFLAILIGILFRNLLAHSAGSKKGKWVLIFVSVLVFLDYYSVARTKTEVLVPPCYAAILSAENETFGILDLPVSYRDNEKYMMYQTIHRFPLVTGLIARRFTPSLIDSINLDDLENQKAQLQQNRVKYIVLHKKPLVTSGDFPDPEQYKKYYSSIYEDAGQIVFQVY